MSRIVFVYSTPLKVLHLASCHHRGLHEGCYPDYLRIAPIKGRTIAFTNALPHVLSMMDRQPLCFLVWIVGFRRGSDNLELRKNGGREFRFQCIPRSDVSFVEWVGRRGWWQRQGWWRVTRYWRSFRRTFQWPDTSCCSSHDVWWQLRLFSSISFQCRRYS